MIEGPKDRALKRESGPAPSKHMIKVPLYSPNATETHRERLSDSYGFQGISEYV